MTGRFSFDTFREERYILVGMSRRRDVFAEALELPVKRRARLARELLVSLDDGPVEDPAEVERTWAEEIRRRVDEIKAGTAKTVPWSTVAREIEADLARIQRARARRGRSGLRKRAR